MSLPARCVRALDRFQQRHAVVGFPFAVLRKLGDDKGGNLATLLAWNAFFALLPLILLLVMLLGFALGRSPELAERVLHSTLAQLPVIGDQLRENVQTLKASGAGLVLGLAGFLWGARGITQAGQHAMAEVWNIPGKDRPSLWVRQVRGIVLLFVFGLGVVSATSLAWISGVSGSGTPAVVMGAVGSLAVNVALFTLTFRVLTPKLIATRDLVPGIAVAAVSWFLLQMAGGQLVSRNLQHASDVYGVFAGVLGLMSWLYLGSFMTLFAAEVNVVRSRRLWPRSIVQPPLTTADRDVLAALAMQEQRRPEERIDIAFGAPVSARAPRQQD